MPNMANITVKKADGTTDIIYDALAPSGSDGTPAVWRQDTGAAAGLPVGMRSSLQLRSVNNGPKTARRVEGTFKMPYAVQDTTTTLYQARDNVVITVQAVVPQAIPSATINEAVHQALNLFASSLIKSSTATGYAPT